jgi:predicted Zn-dependent protease with MMP-like domain
VQFRILGPIEALVDGQPAALGAPARVVKSRYERAELLPYLLLRRQQRGLVWKDTHSETPPRIGAMNEESEADFEQLISDALDELPDDIRDLMTNVAVTVEDEPPPGQNLLGLYQGIPWGRRGPYYAGALPDKITIYRGPMVRITGGDPERLRQQVRRTVFHEIAHHFGISDQRLVDIDRY